MNPNSSLMIGVMAQAGVPALQVAFALALIVLVFGGILVFHRRSQLLNRLSHLASGGPIVRQSGEGPIIIIGSALMLLLVGVLHQVWSA